MHFRPRRPPLSLPLPPHPPNHRRLPLPRLPFPPLLPGTPPPGSQVPLPYLIPTVRPFSSNSPDPSDDLIHRFSSIVSSLFSADRNMEAVLDRSGLSPTPLVVACVLERFRHAHRPAYRFFRWAGGLHGYTHDEACYCKMLTVLASTRQLETMVTLLEEMGRKGMLSPDAFRVSVRAFARAREMKKAVAMFALMERHGLDVGGEGFNGMLLALVEEKMAKEAHLLFIRLKVRYPPNLQTYTILLSGWCKVRNLVEAGKVWNEMIDNGMMPDIVTHNIMLHGLIRGQKWPEAIKLYELMKSKGPRPSSCTYNILIEDLCKHKKLDRALACFQEMLADDGCAPDSITYTSLIMGFGKAKRIHEIPGLLREMQERGCPPDGKMYNTIIKVVSRQGLSDDALKIYKRMIKMDILPTIQTFNMLLRSYSRANNHEMCHAVWEEMEKRGVCPDDNSYTLVITALIRQGRPEEAIKYLEDMINKGMKAPSLDLNKMAADFSRMGKPDALYEFAEEMSMAGKSAAAEVVMDLARRMERTRVLR